MNTPPTPDDEPLLDEQEFIERMKNDPAFAQTIREACEMALALPLNDETAEMHRLAEQGLRSLKHHDSTHNAEQLLLKARALIQEALNGHVENLIPQLRDLTDEASDHLLDAPEPHRTHLMTGITELREMIRKMAGKT